MIYELNKRKFRVWLIISLVLFVISFSIFAYTKNKISNVNNLPLNAQMNENVKNAYLFATKNPEILEQVPCYCGCDDIGHQSNKDCYLDDQGNFVDHASSCGGCVGITLDVERMLNEGYNIDEINDYIKKEYDNK